MMAMPGEIELLAILPTPFDLFVVFPLSIAFVTLSAYIAAVVKKRGVRTGFTRKIFHFIVFTTAFILSILYPVDVVAAFGAGAGVFVLAVIFFKNGFMAPLYNALARESDEPHRDYYLIMPFIATAIGGILAIMLFPQWYYAGYLATGWGDAAGEPIGVKFGRHRFRVPTLSATKCTRTLEGSLGVFLASGAAIMVAIAITGSLTPYTAASAILAALAMTMVESISPHGLDNLTTMLTVDTVLFLFPAT